jgi:hypothetical protein
VKEGSLLLAAKLFERPAAKGTGASRLVGTVRGRLTKLSEGALAQASVTEAAGFECSGILAVFRRELGMRAQWLAREEERARCNPDVTINLRKCSGVGRLTVEQQCLRSTFHSDAGDAGAQRTTGTAERESAGWSTRPGR